MNSKILIPILKQFNSVRDKQDDLLKFLSKEMINEYSCSELHCIKSIGSIKNPNVTKISDDLRVTRGAISKMTKKLIDKGLIISYMLDCNKKEIYFKLTELGVKIYEEHERWHEDFEKRSSYYFDKYSDEELNMVKDFVDTYILYIDSKIDTLKKKEKSK